MITVPRHRRKKSPFEVSIGAARRMAGVKLSALDKLFAEKQREENRRDRAAIRRYAKKHCMELFFHRKPWVFRAQNGEKVEMPAGYHTWADGILQPVVAK